MKKKMGHFGKKSPQIVKHDLLDDTMEKPIAPPIIVERPVLHVDRQLSLYRVRFHDLDGTVKHIDIPRKSFSTKREAVELLLNAHAQLPLSAKAQRECVDEALENLSSKKTLQLTDRLGWTRDSRSFVYFGKTYGPAADDLQLDFDSNRNPALGKKRGSLNAWREGLKAACEVSDQLVVAISIAASGPLLGVVPNAEAAIYHFEGAKKPNGDTRKWKSASGKTLCASAAQSLFGECSRTALFGFNMTALAVEETAHACNYMVAVLDEDGTASEASGSKSVDAKALPYLLVGGQGRRRSKLYAAGNDAGSRNWSTQVITTSENELDAGTQRRQEGSIVRMVAVPFPPTWEGGTFRRCKDSKRRSELAKQVEATLDANYGVAMPMYLERLVAERQQLARDVIHIRDGFVKEVGASADSWERRYAEKFAILFAAAALMVRFGIAPWTEERAKTAIKNVYRKSRGMTASVPQAADAVVAKLVKLVRGDRFHRVPVGEAVPKSQRARLFGILRDMGEHKDVAIVIPRRFEKLVQPPAIADLVLYELGSRGLLLTDGNGKNLKRQVEIRGFSKSRRRYVCIKGLVTKRSGKKWGKKS